MVCKSPTIYNDALRLRRHPLSEALYPLEVSGAWPSASECLQPSRVRPGPATAQENGEELYFSRIMGSKRNLGRGTAWAPTVSRADF